jgi:tetratricopeptide (TPR) repeat protein
MFEAVLEAQKTKLGPDHPNTLTSQGNLASAYRAAGNIDRAMPLYESALTGLRGKLGGDHPVALSAQANFAVALLAGEQYERGVALFNDLLDRRRRLAGDDDGKWIPWALRIGEEFTKCGQFAAAESHYRACLAVRQAKEPDAWSTFNTQSMLGGTLLGQKKYSEAEPLLVAGFAGMEDRKASIPEGGKPRLPEAARRLVELYSALDRPTEVAKWKAKLDALSAEGASTAPGTSPAADSAPSRP